MGALAGFAAEHSIFGVQKETEPGRGGKGEGDIPSSVYCSIVDYTIRYEGTRLP